MRILGVDPSYSRGTAIAVYETTTKKWMFVGTSKPIKRELSPRTLRDVRNSYKRLRKNICKDSISGKLLPRKIFIEEGFIKKTNDPDASLKFISAVAAISMVDVNKVVWVDNRNWKKLLGDEYLTKDEVREKIDKILIKDVLTDLGQPNRTLTQDEYDAIGICNYGICTV